MKSARNNGFTLIEAMVSAALLAIGIASAMGGYGALTKAQTQLQERDRMQRLAISKYDELVAQDINNAPSNGDFQDYNEDRYKWTADTQTTATTGLMLFRVTVTPVNASDNNQATAEGLIYSAESATNGTTGAGG